METFEFNYSVEELKKRTDKEYLSTKKMLAVDAPEYLALADGDKKALKNLVKAAYFIEKVFKRQDNPHNAAFEAFLENLMLKGNEQAELTHILFSAQKGMCAIDRETTPINLAKGITELPGKGLYPEDLSKEEFHNILIKMLNEGNIEDVRKILNQRTVVERKDDELTATDYVKYFSEEFRMAAEKLEEAADTSTNDDFNEYLRLQAVALREADPMLDAYADKKWAELQDTPLEFTITRENYADGMTESVIENEELKKLLDQHKIKPISKDFLGGRVGIVNPKGTEAILKIKEYLPLLAANMPYHEEYEQNISKTEETKQTMIDADIVVLAGDVGAYRAGITLAENLPNDDKLSLTIGGGRRNVYHRQIRFISDKEKLQKRLDAILEKDQHKFYLDEADHWFTIGHENTHSLGPNKGTEALGKYKSIIEENKADMGGLAFLDLLEEKGMYTHEQVLQMLVTFAADNFLKSKPTLSQAHRVRTVMQTKYFVENGAIELNSEGKIHVNIDKMIPTAKKMLAEIVRIQIDADFQKAEDYVLSNFIWTDEMETISQKLKEIDKTLNGRTESPLAIMLLKS